MHNHHRASGATLALIASALLTSSQLPVAQTPAPAAEPQLGYDGGFYLRSADGRHSITLEGLFQTSLRLNGSDREPETEFVLKRMRPELAGTFDEHYHFRLEPNFTAAEVVLEEAWVGADVFGDDLLMVGRMKAPFNLEEVRSRRYIPFPVFSIINQFAPAEQHGLFVNGNAGRAEYGVAVYNGGGADEGDDGKEVAGRFMWHPFRAGGARASRRPGTTGRRCSRLSGCTSRRI